ncbi:MAG: hypothetical protein JXM70_14780 [Pirellulales bacterium]|nr:hypothetical protein [Pirellulales bacterium]
MSANNRNTLSPVHLLHILCAHPWHWLCPALVIAAVALFYAVVRPDTWAASQALIVRNEAVFNSEGSGRFDHVDQMKTLQETILEVARSRPVLEAALKDVGPADHGDLVYQWPTDSDIDKFRDAIAVTPPNGSEFGTTEIFYLTVKDKDRRRAVALNEAVCHHLQNHLKSIRDIKARSIESELVKATTLARADLENSTSKLVKIERSVGSDLAELRVLSGSTSGDSALRRSASDIRTELREAGTTQKANEELLDVLKKAQNDPGSLVAAPNRLFETQQSLRRLKDGLVDAQLETAKLRGSMLDTHPAVMAAADAEKEIGRHLHNELEIAIRGLESEIQMDSDRVALLNERLASVEERLVKLADVRAVYSNLAAETTHRAELLEQTERNLSQARASKASADAVSLISLIGTPDTGSRPQGPGRATIVLMGICGGILAGFGVLLLTVDNLAPGKSSINGHTANLAAETLPPAGETDDRLLTTVSRQERLNANGKGRTPLSEALHKLVN